jgi:hypothetical protein
MAAAEALRAQYRVAGERVSCRYGIVQGHGVGTARHAHVKRETDGWPVRAFFKRGWFR